MYWPDDSVSEFKRTESDWTKNCCVIRINWFVKKIWVKRFVLTLNMVTYDIAMNSWLHQRELMQLQNGFKWPTKFIWINFMTHFVILQHQSSFTVIILGFKWHEAFSVNCSYLFIFYKFVCVCVCVCVCVSLIRRGKMSQLTELVLLTGESWLFMYTVKVTDRSVPLGLKVKPSKTF